MQGDCLRILLSTLTTILHLRRTLHLTKPCPPVSTPNDGVEDDVSDDEEVSLPMEQVARCDPEVVEPVAVSLAAAIEGISQACITATGKDVSPSAHERLAGLLSDAHSVMRMVRNL